MGAIAIRSRENRDKTPQTTQLGHCPAAAFGQEIFFDDERARD
jgi:hypothetical protein